MNYENFTVSNIKYAYACCCMYCICTNSTVFTRRSTSFTPCLNFTPGTELRHTRWRNRGERRSLRAEGPNTTEHSEGHGEGREGDMLQHQGDEHVIIKK
jgi:hypothetical protein